MASMTDAANRFRNAGTELVDAGAGIDNAGAEINNIQNMAAVNIAHQFAQMQEQMNRMEQSMNRMEQNMNWTEGTSLDTYHVRMYMFIVVMRTISPGSSTYRLASPGATRRRQGVERAKTLVIFANSIKASKAIKYLAIDHTKK